jgi:hypothetical protein
MSKLTKIGLIFSIAAILMLGYQGGLALMGSDKMGSDFVWINITPADFFSETVFSLINGIPFSMAQRVIRFLVGMPLFAWFFGVALIFFMIQAFRSGKA